MMRGFALPAALVAALAAAGVLAMVAIREARQADAQRDAATSRALAAAAMENLDRAPDVAILLALEAYRHVEDGSDTESYEARHGLASALTRHPRLRTVHRIGNDTVAAVTFSADGSRLAASDAEGRVRIWDLDSGTETRMAERGVGSCYSEPFDVDLRFGIDGQTLVSAGCGAAAPFDLDSGKRRRSLGGPSDSLGEEESDGVLSPDGRLLAWHGEYTGLRLLDTHTGKQLRRGVGKGDRRLFPVAFTGDGRALAAYPSYTDQPARLWDVRTGAPLGRPIPGRLLGLTDTGDRGAIRRGRRVLIWDIGRGVAVGKALEVASPLRGAFDRTGTLLAVSSDDGHVRVWRLAGARRTLEAQLRHDGVAGLRFSPDGRLLATGGVDGTVRVWDVASRPLAARIRRGYTYEVAFSPDGRWLATSGDYSAALWSLADGTVVGEPRVVSRGIGYNLAFSPDGDTIASTFEDPGAVGLWDVESARPRMRRRADEYETNAVAFSPDGSLLASAGEGARLWDPATGSQIGKPFGANFDSVAFSPDGSLLAAWASPDYSSGILRGVRFWDVEKRARVGEPLRTVPAAVAFGPDGMLAVVREDGRVELWNVADRSLVDTIRAHTATSLEDCCFGGTTLAFSPDGRTLATGGYDGVRLWDLARTAPLGDPLPAPRTWDVAIGADSELLASAGDGGTLLWDRILLSRDLEAWQARLCPIASRNLTEAEWERFLPDEPYRETCAA